MTAVRSPEPKWQRSFGCADSNCLEVLRSEDEVLLRNSRTAETVLRFTPREWEIFLDGVKRGDFD